MIRNIGRLNALIFALENRKPIDIVCIGTPRIIGDSVGPLVGTMLSKHRYNHNLRIVGTLDNPLTSESYPKLDVRKGAFVVAIDAAVGKKYPYVDINLGELSPAACMNKKLQPVGNLSILCFTGRDLNHLLGCGLQLPYTMAESVTAALHDILQTSVDNHLSASAVL